MIVPLDHAADSLPGHDSSIAIVTALQLVERASRSPLPMTLLVAFVSGDQTAAHGSATGSAVLVTEEALLEPSAVVYPQTGYRS